MLNEEKRLTPAEYNRLYGQVKRNTKSITENPIWEPTKVANILRNPIYTGDYIMRKQVPVVPGSKKRRPTDPSEQFVIKQAHEAIVSYEEYEKVQLLMHFCSLILPLHMNVQTCSNSMPTLLLMMKP